MKLLQFIFSFYINSSIHVGLAVYALVRITELYVGLPYNNPLDCCIFFATIIGYNFIKYSSTNKFDYQKRPQKLKIIWLFSLGCFLTMLYYVAQLPLQTLLFFTPFVLLTLLYTIPILPKFSSLRNIPSFKILIIAFVWSGVTVLLPVIDAQLSFKATIIWFAIQRLLFVVVLTLPFDIRDCKHDKIQLQTIPQLIGLQQTKKMGFVLLGVVLLIEFFFAPMPYFKTVFLVVFFALLVLLQRASTHQNAYYASFWVESIPIFWWILLQFN